MDRPVLIILTGGRSTPAVSGALALQPRAIEFINSRDEPYREVDIRGALAGLVGLEPSEPGIAVDAYSADEAFEACERLVARHANGPFAINLSAGTKVMAIGAYEFARKSGLSAFYVVTGQAELLDLTKRQKLPTLPMDVAGYLACFRRTPRRKKHLTRKEALTRSELARRLVDAGAPALAVLEAIRCNGKGKGERTCGVGKYTPTSAELDTWTGLVEEGLLTSFSSVQNGFEFTLPSDSAFAFLSGVWLEMYVHDRACEQVDASGAPIFNDVISSFEIPSNVTGGIKEVDVGLMVSGQLIHCSCKSGKTKIWVTDHLDELRAVSDLVGADYCTRVFIASKHPPLSEDREEYGSYQQFLRQAQDRKIVVIAGDRLAQVGQLLADEARKPTYPRI